MSDSAGDKASRLIQQSMVTLARQEQPPPPAGRPAPRLASRCELSVCLLSLVVPSPLCPPRKKMRQRQDQPKKRIYSSAKIFSVEVRLPQIELQFLQLFAAPSAAPAPRSQTARSRSHPIIIVEYRRDAPPALRPWGSCYPAWGGGGPVLFYLGACGRSLSPFGAQVTMKRTTASRRITRQHLSVGGGRSMALSSSVWGASE